MCNSAQPLFIYLFYFPIQENIQQKCTRIVKWKLFNHQQRNRYKIWTFNSGGTTVLFELLSRTRFLLRKKERLSPISSSADTYHYCPIKAWQEELQTAYLTEGRSLFVSKFFFLSSCKHTWQSFNPNTYRLPLSRTFLYNHRQTESLTVLLCDVLGSQRLKLIMREKERRRVLGEDGVRSLSRDRHVPLPLERRKKNWRLVKDQRENEVWNWRKI